MELTPQLVNSSPVHCSNSTMCLGNNRFEAIMIQRCRVFEFAVSLVLVGVTCCLGLVGNILSILTLRRDTTTMKSVTTFLLTVLAVADMSFILPAIVVIMVPTYCQHFDHCASSLKPLLRYIEQFGWVVTSFGHSCTLYVTVLVAVHRYFYVCRPHDSHRLSSMRRVRCQAALVPIGSIIFSIPRMFEYQVKYTKHIHPLNNRSSYETRKVLAEIGSSLVYQVVYKNILYYLLMYIIPLTVLIVLSTRLAQVLHRRRVRFRGLHSSINQHHRDDTITLMLIIIIGVFLICQTPTLVKQLMLTVSGTDGHSCGRAYFYVEQVADYMILLNSCVNFVIYVLFARRFRHTLMKEVLNCSCPKFCGYCHRPEVAVNDAPGNHASGKVSSKKANKSSKNKSTKTSSSKRGTLESTDHSAQQEMYRMRRLSSPDQPSDVVVCNGNQCTATSVLPESPSPPSGGHGAQKEKQSHFPELNDPELHDPELNDPELHDPVLITRGTNTDESKPGEQQQHSETELLLTTGEDDETPLDAPHS